MIAPKAVQLFHMSIMLQLLMRWLGFQAFLLLGKLFSIYASEKGYILILLRDIMNTNLSLRELNKNAKKSKHHKFLKTYKQKAIILFTPLSSFILFSAQSQDLFLCINDSSTLHIYFTLSQKSEHHIIEHTYSTEYQETFV